MAEHTPTDAEVRESFVDGAAGEFIGEDFDRWLAEVRRETAEKAWDEGLVAERAALGASEVFGFVIAPEPNPYTKTESSDE